MRAITLTSLLNVTLETELICVNTNEIPVMAKKLLELSDNRKVWFFYGEMGAGKTTLIKAICAQLGMKDDLSSPTFSIVNEYVSGNKKVYHFDLYRIKKPEELVDIGFEEYIESGNYCFIEWPELIGEKWVDNPFHIRISTEGTIRKIACK